MLRNLRDKITSLKSLLNLPNIGPAEWHIIDERLEELTQMVNTQIKLAESVDGKCNNPIHAFLVSPLHDTLQAFGNGAHSDLGFPPISVTEPYSSVFLPDYSAEWRKPLDSSLLNSLSENEQGSSSSGSSENIEELENPTYRVLWFSIPFPEMSNFSFYHFDHFTTAHVQDFQNPVEVSISSFWNWMRDRDLVYYMWSPDYFLILDKQGFIPAIVYAKEV